MKKLKARLSGAGNIFIMLLVATLLTVATSCGDSGTGVDPEPPDPPEPPTEKHPDEVTFTITPKDDDSVADDAWIVLKTKNGKIDTLGTGKQTVTIEWPDLPADICASGPYFKDSPVCQSGLKPETEKKTVTLNLKRRQVIPEIYLEFPKDEPVYNGAVLVTLDGKVVEPLGESYSIPIRVKLGARAGTRKLVAEYGRAKVIKRIPADKSIETTVAFADYPNCNNTFDDDRDGKPDAEDTGCATDAGITMVDGEKTWTHDPEDDKEVVKGHTTTSITWDILMLVSSAKNHRKQFLTDDHKVPSSISVALRIGVFANVFVEAQQDGEAFAFKIFLGKNFLPVYTTSIVKDDGSDGYKRYFKFIPNDTFEDKQIYKVIALHASLVRSEPPGDGKDDVVFSKNDGVKRGYFGITWGYEPEDVPKQGAAQYYQKPSNPNVIIQNYDNVTEDFFRSH